MHFGKKDSTGKVISRANFKQADNEFQEDSLAYNFKSQRGVSYGVRTQQGEAHLLSAVSKKAQNNWISVGRGKFTTCDKENPHYHFHLSKAMVIPNEKVVSGPFYLAFRKIPTPLALPFGFFPNKRESAQGILLPGYGNGNEKGFFLQNLGYYVPVSQFCGHPYSIRYLLTRKLECKKYHQLQKIISLQWRLQCITYCK